MRKGTFYKVLFPILLISTFSFGKLQGGFISWFLFYAIFILSIYIWLVARYSIRSIRVKRMFKKPRLTAGDTIEVEIEIMNLIDFPHSYLLIEDDRPDKLKHKIPNKKYIAYPWFRSKSIINYSIPSAERGIHKWRHIKIITGDIFGIIKIEKIIKLNSDIVVYPKSFPIKRWFSMNERNQGTAFTQNKISEDTASVVGIREYRKGDRFNRIHWKQSAKSMQLMTKEFERLITNDFVMILNQNKNDYPNEDVFERSVELTAGLVKYAISNRFSTGFISEGNYKSVISMSRDKGQVSRVFEVLAMVEADSQVPFVETIKSEAPYLHLGVTLVLVTTKIDDDLYHLLGELAIRKIKVEVFVLASDLSTLEENSKINMLKQLNITIHYISTSDLGEINRLGGIAIG